MGLGSGRSEVSAPRRRVTLPPAVWLIALSCLVFQLAAAPHYGYFRDELYCLACAKRLDWGYVDQPPLSLALLALWTRWFGTSLLAIRVPVALCHAGLVLVNARLAFHFRPSSAVLAALATAVAPVYMVVGHFYAMNGLDVLLSALLVLAWVLAEEEPRWWLAWGVLLGFGILNKWSILWLGAGICLAMLLTPRRKDLTTWFPWLGLLLTGLFAAPNVIWQVQHGWPTLEFLRHARDHKMLPVPLWQFPLIQIGAMNILAAPIWILGLWVSWRDPKLRPLAVAFTFVFLLLMLGGKSRPNYLSPSLALVLPVGASMFVGRRALGWYGGILVASGVLHALVVLPLLPLPVLRSILTELPTPPSDERGPKSPLQGHADTLGWKELAAATQAELDRIPAAERGRTVVLASNYGEAAALEFYGIPRVLCPHNNYWLWGPGDWDGSSAVLVGREPAFDDAFSTVEAGAPCPPREGTPDEASLTPHLARGLKEPMAAFWERARRFE